MKASHKSIHSMPLSHEIDDQTIIHGYKHSEADFVRQVRDAFEVHYTDSATRWGQLATVTIHPWMTGQPHRIKALKEALSHVIDRVGVWLASGAKFLAAFQDQ